MSSGKQTVDRQFQLAKVKKELLERKQELESQLESLSKEKVSDDQVQDAGDQALAIVMENLRSSLQNAEYEEYTRIVRALSAIDSGTFGICVDCGMPISERRLKHYPDASRCIACQEAFESRGGSS